MNATSKTIIEKLHEKVPRVLAQDICIITIIIAVFVVGTDRGVAVDLDRV